MASSMIECLFVADTADLFHRTQYKLNGKLNYSKVDSHFIDIVRDMLQDEANADKEGFNVLRTAFIVKTNTVAGKFAKSMEHNGYTPVMRTAESSNKVNFGAAVATTCMEFLLNNMTAPTDDPPSMVVVLLVASADYAPLVTFLKEQGVTVFVGGSGIQRALREAAGDGFYLDFDASFLEQREQKKKDMSNE